MTRKEVCDWMSEIEDCMVRAEKAKKDVDLRMVLRVLYKMLSDMEKETR